VHCFALIIGTEILNRRRRDAHFDFLSKVLADKGYTLKGSFVIEDDPALIVQTIRFIASQPHAILFSFGGIGSTPDDHTRHCASMALRDGTLPIHSQAKKSIEDTLKEKAYPHAIKMASLPKGSDLLYNSINNMPAFSLDNKYFFMPGFPEMSHPMVEDILAKIILEKKMSYRHTLRAECKESMLIEVMEKMPKEVEFSSLPKLHKKDKTWTVSISVASTNQALSLEAFNMYTQSLKKQNIAYTLEDDT